MKKSHRHTKIVHGSFPSMYFAVYIQHGHCSSLQDIDHQCRLHARMSREPSIGDGLNMDRHLDL